MWPALAPGVWGAGTLELTLTHATIMVTRAGHYHAGVNISRYLVTLELISCLVKDSELQSIDFSKVKCQETGRFSLHPRSMREYKGV